MPSPESLRIRQTLTKESVDPTRSLDDERRDWNAYGATLPLASGITDRTETIGGVECLWLEPKKPRPGIILYAHGGGLVSGSILTHRAFASKLAKATGRTVLLPDYRLIPEHAFDAPRADMLSVYAALIDRGTDPNTIALAGDSNGAGLALATAIALRDAKQPMPACLASISGAFDVSLSGETIGTKNGIDPVLSEAALLHWQRIFRDTVALDDPAISPLFADLRDLPPTLLLAGSDEVWLSDTTRTAEKLGAAGNRVETSIYDGMWHVWPMWDDLPEATEALAHIKQHLDTNFAS